jgi:hypothetical protein
MLWKTNRNGAYRCVRLIDGLAVKTPHLFKYEDLVFYWQKAGRPKSPLWWFRQWWSVLYRGCKHNEQEVRRWCEMGTREINDVRLCPIRYHLRYGLLVVMTKAEPLNRTVSMTEDMAAGALIGKFQDTGKPDTFGLVNGRVVVVDYGWWVPGAPSFPRSLRKGWASTID